MAHKPRQKHPKQNRRKQKPNFPLNRRNQQLLRDNILPMIQEVEREDKAKDLAKDGKYHPNFEAMLSAVCLAFETGPRTATWPAWESIHVKRYMNYITRLNRFIPKSRPKLVVVDFQHEERSGNIKSKRILTRDDNRSLVRRTTLRLTDINLGKICGFYPPNARNYAKDLPGQSYAFQILVSPLKTGQFAETSNTLLFAEIFFPDPLSHSEKQKFRKYCKKRIHNYNKIMRRLDWPYRFHSVVEETRQPGSISQPTCRHWHGCGGTLWRGRLPLVRIDGSGLLRPILWVLATTF